MNGDGVPHWATARGPVIRLVLAVSAWIRPRPPEAEPKDDEDEGHG